jgi:hypothetical protein
MTLIALTGLPQSLITSFQQANFPGRRCHP